MEKRPKRNVTLGLAKFFIPILLGLGVFGAIGFLMEESLRIVYWPLISGYFFPPLGKESIIPLGVASGIHPVVMGEESQWA